MFGLFKKKAAPAPKPSVPFEQAIRDTLFGDKPMDDWCLDKPDSAPWASFARAHAAVARKDNAGAVDELRRVLAMPGLEARHYLQAWHFLRELGEAPEDSEARKVLGVVVEVGMPRGVDLLAAYADGSARYYNFSGRSIIWERPDDSLDAELRAVLQAGSAVAAAIGPWDGKGRPAPPPTGQGRLNLLTPSGLMFGQASMEALSTDPLGGRLLSSATRLLQGLIAKTQH